MIPMSDWRGWYHRKLRGYEFEDVVPWHELIEEMSEDGDD